MKIDQYCQRQRYKHVELEQFWQAFASRGFVSDSWAFLLFIGCEDKWFILLEHATAATSFASHSFNIWTFLRVSTRQCPGSPCSQNDCTAAVGRDAGLHRTAVLYPRQRRTLWTSDLNIVIVRLRTSCYWVAVQSYVYVILFTVWFLSNAKMNFTETLHYSL